MNQQAIVRHYRAATMAEAEQAYRADADRAATIGYIPVSQGWSTDWEGYVLVVTYRTLGPIAASTSIRQESEPAPSEFASRAETSPVAARGAAPEAGREGNHFEPPEQVVDSDLYTQFAPREEASPRTSLDPSLGYRTEADSPRAYVPPAPDHARASSHPAETTLTFAPPAAGYNPAGSMFAPAADLPSTDLPGAELQAAPLPAADLQTAPLPDADRQTAPLPAEQAPQHPQSPAADAWLPPHAWYTDEPSTLPREMLEPHPVGTPSERNGTKTDHAAARRRRSRLTVQTMDLHCAGEPLRIVRSGFPDVPSLPVLDRRRWVMEHADDVRRALIQEPRGHRDMYGAILLPPYSDYADMCVLFMHNEGYSTMCGHGIIAITTGLIEEGLFPASGPVTTIRYEVPAGIVAANAATSRQDDGSWAVQGVRFTNVPSYLAAQSLAVQPDGVTLHGNAADYGALSVDLAFGGAFYGIVNAAELGLRVVADQAEELRRVGAAITDVLRRDHTPSHPTDAALSFVYGTIIVDYDPRTAPDGLARQAHLRNATIFADAELDRSPCGSGTSAILAQLHARGRMKVGQEVVNAGITGEHFLGRIEAETALGPYPAVSTSVAGTAYITGYSTFVVDSRDPLGEGFLIR